MKNELYNIGQAARASGMTAKTIRHYEEGGLIPKAARTYSGYRLYHEKDIHMLRFIKNARTLGFSIKQISELIGLWRDHGRPSSKVKSLAQEHIKMLESKIEELNAMKKELKKLVDCCRGDDRLDCPILDSLTDRNS